MSILRILAYAGMALKERDNWVAIFDERPEFREGFGTNRVGKVMDERFYITPKQLAMPAGLLIKGLGYELLHLPSTNGASSVVYPGVDTTGLSEAELAAFVAHLREAIDNRVGLAAQAPQALQHQGKQHHRANADGEQLASLPFIDA